VLSGDTLTLVSQRRHIEITTASLRPRRAGCGRRRASRRAISRSLSWGLPSLAAAPPRSSRRKTSPPRTGQRVRRLLWSRHGPLRACVGDSRRGRGTRYAVVGELRRCCMGMRGWARTWTSSSTSSRATQGPGRHRQAGGDPAAEGGIGWL